MSVLETIRVALASIVSNLLRSTLTMLGIIIGVAAVITMVALGSGAQRAIDEQIDSLGARLLSVFPGQSMFRGVASADRVSLTVDDYEALERDSRFLSAVVPEITAGSQIKYGNKNIYQSVTGTTPNYLDVNGRDLVVGSMFTEADVTARRRVAVLGYSVPDSLGIQPASLIGQTISIRRVNFEIIGVR